MDARKRKMLGWVVAAVGVVVAVVGGLADQLGLGGDGGWDNFGSRQIVALVAGVILIVAGVWLARSQPGRHGAAEASTTGDAPLETAPGPAGPGVTD